MNAILEEYFEKKRNESNAVRDEFLISEGLFERVYYEENEEENRADYPFYEWDTKGNVSRYYKKVPIEVTDEEYEQIKKYAGMDSAPGNNNVIANVLTVIAWLTYICGFIAGIILGQDAGIEFDMQVAFIYWATTFVSGTMLLGFAEIIKLLTAIKNK